MEKVAQVAFVVSDPAHKLVLIKAVRFNNDIKILAKSIWRGAGGFVQDCASVVVLAATVPIECEVSFYIIAGYSKPFDGQLHEAVHAEFIDEEAIPDCFSKDHIAYKVVELPHNNDAFHDHGIEV